jgi:hypothetical protein
MKIQYILAYSLLFPLSVFADDSLFCPQHYGTITTGMSTQQVIAACGQPVSKRPSNKPITRDIPMVEYFFNNEGTPVASVAPGTSNGTYYGLWTNPTAVSGATLQINAIDNKIHSIQINGADENAASICEGQNLVVGDPVSKALNACGTPLLVNNTFVKQVINTVQPPEVWIYQMGQYQAPVSLTFVAGTLQSIN